MSTGIYERTEKHLQLLEYARSFRPIGFVPKSAFKKGQIISDELKEQNRERMKKMWQEKKLKSHPCLWKGNHIQTNTGRTHFKEGNIPWNKNKKGYSTSKKGRKFGSNNISEETRAKIRERMTGENSPNWIKDRTKLAKRQKRNDMAYKEWRLNVWKRDNWKCRINNQDCCGKIKAHHILPWRDFQELRYEVNNGITLCQAHHPRKRAEEKRLIPFFNGLVSVSNEPICQ